MTDRTPKRRLALPMALMASLFACADPGPVSEFATEPREVTEPSPAPAGPAATELSADALETFATPEQAIAAYRGPRVAVTPNIDAVQAGVAFTLTASVTDADGAPVPLDDSMTFRWRLPDGWQLEGEGPEVTVTPSDVLPDGTDPIDVGVAIDRDGVRLVRGGVMLAR